MTDVIGLLLAVKRRWLQNKDEDGLGHDPCPPIMVGAVFRMPDFSGVMASIIPAFPMVKPSPGSFCHFSCQCDDKDIYSQLICCSMNAVELSITFKITMKTNKSSSECGIENQNYSRLFLPTFPSLRPTALAVNSACA